MINIISILFIPLILSNIMHMFIVKFDWFSYLKYPINEKIFGANKTIRGFIVLALLTGLFELIFDLSFASFSLGIILGFSYAIFELPNSFIKRRLDINPGQSPKNKKWLFILMDKSDSTFGVTLVFVLIKGLDLSHFVIIFFSALIIHFILSYLLFRLKIKASL